MPSSETQVWLGDSMGEMAAYYAAADLALIGGSLLPFGGQNLIEAAACGCPTLVGPHTFNFSQAAEDATACGAARRVGDVEQAATAAGELLGNRRKLQDMRAAALAFSRAHRGATARTVALIRETSSLQTTR
jgi:3-deoxy-D-manno-octulosonic-acid transferase